MSDVFISYSRKNAAIVRRIHAAMIAAGRETWVDWKDIPPTARWMTEIRTAIDAASDFVIVLSPAALNSETCHQELEHALQHNKRLIPVVVDDVRPEDVSDAVRSINWIFCRAEDDFNAAVSMIIKAIDLDLDLAKIHTRVLIRAREWAERNMDDSYLLRGSDLREALVWLTASGDRKGPTPSALHSTYVQASQDAESRELARTTRLYNQALARQLAAQARDIEREHPEMLELSVLLAVESIRRYATAEATAVLRELIPLLPRRLSALSISPTPGVVEFSPNGDLLVTAAGRMSPRESERAKSMEDYLDMADLERGISLANTLPEDPSYGVVQLWDPLLGREIARFEHDRAVLAVVFSRHERRLATRTSRGEVRLWSLDTFKEDHGTVPPDLDQDEYQRRRSRRLTATPFLQKILDLQDRQRIDEMLRDRGIEPPKGKNKGRAVRALLDDLFNSAADFTNDGRFFFEKGSSAQPTAISMRSTLDGYEVSRIALKPGFRALAVHPANAIVATSGGYSVEVWETTGEWTALLLDEDFRIERVRFSPEKALLAVAEGGSRARVRVWDLETGSSLTDPARTDALVAALGDPPAPSSRQGPQVCHGRHVEISWDTWEKTVVVRAGDDKEPGLMLESDSRVEDVRVALDDTVLLVRGLSEIRIWALPGGQLLGEFDLAPDTALSAGALSPDGKMVAAGDYAGRVGIWQVESGTRIGRFAHEDRVGDAVFSADGRFLITASEDRTARVWDLGSGTCVGRLVQDDAIEQIFLNPDETVLATLTARGNVAVWRWRPDDLMVRARELVPRDLTKDEWTQYLGEEPYPF